MKTLCVPLLLMIPFLLQISQSSTEMVKKRIFKEVKGLGNIFKFFGKEMDEKAKMVISPQQTVLKYDEKEATFLLSLPYEKKRQAVNQKALQNSIIRQVGKDLILMGLDNLLMNHCVKDGKTYLSRTGVVKSENGYFILRRSFTVNEGHSQHFMGTKISKNDPYIFWNECFNEQNTYVWINGDFRKYYKFCLTPETEARNVFNRIDFIHRDQYNFWKWKTQVDVVLSAQEMFEDDPQNLSKRKCSQETACSTPPRMSSFSETDEYNLFKQSPPKHQNRLMDDAEKEAHKNCMIKKSKLHKKYQELLENDFQRYTNPYLLAQERIITRPDFKRNVYDEVRRQKVLLLQKDLDSLMSGEENDEYSNINTTEKDENSVLKESLSFIFFEDENLSQAEKHLEFQKLLCNENLKDENLDYKTEGEKYLNWFILICCGAVKF